MQLNIKRCVTAVRCNCVANALGKCKHIYALIHFVNSDRSTSKTSSEPDWGKFPKSQMGKEKYSKGKRISELFPSKTACTNTTTMDARVFRPEDFEGINCGARNIAIAENMSAEEHKNRSILERLAKAKEEKTREDCVRACVENFILFIEPSEFYKIIGNISVNPELMNYYKNFVQLSEAEISDLNA